ncbi:MAG: hypothetical protein BGN85_14050 [Alphaproteobacteria bacterium 64-11]|nr:hypothetical protein [Alphaproteobacteria bacterium]OJU13940.1 MAG: hypothetical protein BGN85_14050 [Alphaproteobacteria bacterium 64-11]
MHDIRHSIAALAVLLLLCACGKSGDQGGAAKQPEKEEAASGVTLSPEQVRSLGITMVAARPAQYRAETSGYGTVVSLDTIAQADSDLLAALAVAAQSRAAAKRARYLFTDQGGAVSRESMEAAVAKADADEAQLTLARRKAQAAFGLNPPWESGGRRAAIMGRLSSGALALIRATFPLGALAADLPQTLSITRLGGNGRRWTSNQIWRAPADPAFPGQGVFALVASSDLNQNEHVTAFVPAGAPQPGVEVPAGAVVYGEGESWIYVRKEKDNFQRVRIDTTRAEAGGYFVPQQAGVRAGDAIVTSGAGLLLARELNPSAEAED